MAYKSSSRPSLKNITRRENPIQKQNWDTLRVLHQIARKKTKESGYGTGIGALSDKRFLKQVIGPMMRGKKLSRTNDDIKDAVDLWCDPATHDQAKERYGDISIWDVSQVTDMRLLFYDREMFDDDDITQWNVSNVTNMYMMFCFSKSFNQNIGRWDVSNVKDMNNMFSNATTFNQDIGGWNVSKVKDMSGMFSNAVAFNQNIGQWDVSNVENMSGMFTDAFAFNQNIGQWDVSKVNNMISMFNNARSFNQDLSGWNVDSNYGNRQVKYVDMFKDCNINKDYRPDFWWSNGGAKNTRRAKRSQNGKRSRKGRRTLKRGSRRTRRR
jgi:surface protein